MSKDCIIFEKNTGLIADFSEDVFPTKVRAWGHDAKSELEITDSNQDSNFGYVYSGSTLLFVNDKQFSLDEGMYFYVKGNFKVDGGSGFIISRMKTKGLFQIGGPIEKYGRLKYIDGCSDTLLVSPWKKGEACLNHLHFPKNISQTEHIHPSNRITIVTNGQGGCQANGKTFTLQPGMIFIIPTNCVHAFFTKKSEMDVITFHPDSDFGPTHENHPMINRTIVGGVSASKIEKIRTKKIE